MNKKINLLEDGTKPSKITYDTNDCILSVDYPKSKFKIGDKVVVKNIKVGSRSTTETTFVSTMQQYINNTYTVKYVFYNGDVSLKGCRGYTFAEEWLQPLSEGVFNKGDIITDGKAYAIYKGMTDIKVSTFRVYAGYCDDSVINSLNWDYIDYYRLATLEEQLVLFDALKKKGKRWNAEALKVEDIEPLFKKGDILTAVLEEDVMLIFDKYESPSMETFESIYCNHVNLDYGWHSSYFRPASKNEIKYLHYILAKDGKKWNAETLEIEDIKKKFKRGDIVYHNNMVSIFDTYTNSAYEFHGLYNVLIDGSPWHIGKFNNQGVRIATTSEQQILFDALKKENKKWDAETLKIKDLDISEIVYNLSSACNYLNKPVPDFKSLLLTISNEDFHKYKAQITLQLIREAWNKFDGFVVDWNNTVQRKYYPQVYVLDGDKISAANWITCASVDSSCYCFKSIERAKQFGTQFKDLLKIAMGIK